MSKGISNRLEEILTDYVEGTIIWITKDLPSLLTLDEAIKNTLRAEQRKKLGGKP